MRALRFFALVLVLAALLILPAMNRTAHSVGEILAADQANVAKTTDSTWTSGSVDLEGVPENDTTTFTFSTKEAPAAAKQSTSTSETLAAESPCTQPPVAEAKANGFDDETNDFIPQGKPLEECAEPVPGTFLDDKAIFEEVDEVADGLGPVYNAQSCRECHQNPVTGAISQITELRAGHTVNDTFFDAPGGSLINNRESRRPITVTRIRVRKCKSASRRCLPPASLAVDQRSPPKKEREHFALRSTH